MRLMIMYWVCAVFVCVSKNTVDRPKTKEDKSLPNACWRIDAESFVMWLWILFVLCSFTNIFICFFFRLFGMSNSCGWLEFNSAIRSISSAIVILAQSPVKKEKKRSHEEEWFFIKTMSFFCNLFLNERFVEFI